MMVKHDDETLRTRILLEAGHMGCEGGEWEEEMTIAYTYNKVARTVLLPGEAR